MSDDRHSNSPKASTNTTEEVLYFERQSRLLCGLHALNNLLGGPIFTVSELDSLAKATGTHHFFGYYDVNAISLAVESKGYELKWFDPRKPIDELDFSSPEVDGVLINIAQTTLFFFTTRHWLCVRKILYDDGTFSLYWMDSRDKKERLMDLETVKTQIEVLRTSKHGQVLYLVKKPLNKEIEIDGSEKET